MSEDVKVEIGGDASPMERAMRDAQRAVSDGVSRMQGQINGLSGVFDSLNGKLATVGAVLAGGKVFKDSVDEAKKLTGEANMLSKALGIGTTEASALNIALGDIYSSGEDFIAASQKLSRELRTNEEGLNAMGLRTREANGEYRSMKDLMFDAIKVLNSYKEGTDRTMAAQAMFGKDISNVTSLLKLQTVSLDDADEKARSLGLAIGVQNVQAAKEYKAAMNDVGDVMSALKKSIGDALMPILTELGTWLSAIGPAAVVVIKGSIGGLVSLFWGLRTAAVMAFQAINGAVVTIAEPIRAVGSAFVKLVQGDFKGAADEIINIPKVIGDTWSGGWDTVVQEATMARDKIWNLFANPDDMAARGAGGRGYVAPPDKDHKAKGAKGEDLSFMQYYEAELAARKNSYEQESLFRQFSKEQELAYWRELQQNLDLTNKDRISIAKRTAMLELEIRRQAAKEQRDLDAQSIDSRKAAELAQIELERQAAQFSLSNGEITKAQLLDQEEQFARRRFEIEYQAQLERIELAKNDPSLTPAAKAQLNEELLALERNYQLRRNEIIHGKEKEVGGLGSIYDDAGIAFKRSVTSMLTTATTLRAQLANIFGAIYQSFITNLIAKPVGEWIAAQAKMLAIKLGFLTQEKGMEAAASATTVGIKTAETTAVVTENAIQAGTGAASSQASIPFVGPMLAMAAMAAIFAAVMGMGGKRKSAAGGFDIPRGMNPLTQLHEEEMVLPKQYANVIRGLAAGDIGAPGASIPTMNINISSPDAEGVRRLLLNNKVAVADAIKSALRDFRR